MSRAASNSITAVTDDNIDTPTTAAATAATVAQGAIASNNSNSNQDDSDDFEAEDEAEVASSTSGSIPLKKVTATEVEEGVRVSRLCAAALCSLSRSYWKDIATSKSMQVQYCNTSHVTSTSPQHYCTA
jgi:hypothetical protein